MSYATHFDKATKALANAGAKANMGDWQGAIEEATRAQTYLYDMRWELQTEKVNAEAANAKANGRT